MFHFLWSIVLLILFVKCGPFLREWQRKKLKEMTDYWTLPNNNLTRFFKCKLRQIRMIQVNNAIVIKLYCLASICHRIRVNGGPIAYTSTMILDVITLDIYLQNRVQYQLMHIIIRELVNSILISLKCFSCLSNNDF